jgi:phosphoribosyl 1,2-cyclic phosphodiesterase
MKFATLASGSSGNCYILEQSGSRLMIEAGISFQKIQTALWTAGLRLRDIDGCLVSHSHGDHSKAAKDLLEFNMRVGMSKACLLDLCVDPLRNRSEILEPEKGCAFGPWHVLPFSVKHDDEYGTLGFAIDHRADGGRLAYVTDARFVGYRIPGVTHWAIEANYDIDILKRNIAKGSLDQVVAKRVIESHMSIETAISALCANDLSSCEKITLIHLSDGNSHAENFKSRMQAATGIPTTIAVKGVAA